MNIRIQSFSYRFAEQVLNSNLPIKHELESILADSAIHVPDLSRPNFNTVLRELFSANGWQDQPLVFDEPGDPLARMDFLKGRVGVEVGFGHSSFLGIDLLKFQVCSYSGLDKIDVGVYIVTTLNFQRTMRREYQQKWDGSLTYEKVTRYLPHFKSAIQVPVYVIGIDI